MAGSGYDEERKLISASLPELDDYLDSEVLFWRIPRLNLMLTPGNLLLAQLRSSQTQETDLVTARDSINQLIAKRQIAWEQKIQKEVPARLNQWKASIDDFRENGSIDANYGYSVRVRVILALLLSRIQYPSTNHVVLLEKMDSLLDLLSIRGSFIWNPELAPLFPESSFPFLFLHPKGGEK